MRVIICGPRDFDNYDTVCKAIKDSGFKITEVVSGGATGADSLGEKWAAENKIPVKPFPAKWNDLNKAGAVIKTNNWGKQYDSNAGFARNEEMAKYAGKNGGCIAVKDTSDTPGTSHMIKTAEAAGLKVYIHQKKKEMGEYAYIF